MKRAVEKKAYLSVVIQELDSRSVSQNSLFHKWCNEISTYFKGRGKTHLECGAPVTPENIKEKMKGTFLPTEERYVYNVAEKKFALLPVPKRTRDLSRGEMFQFMEAVLAFCTEYGIPVSVPSYSEFHLLRKESGSV